MSTSQRLRPVAIFATKFILIAPVCLVIWWTLLPQYVWVLGQTSGTAIRVLSPGAVTGLDVITDDTGVLNTKTRLVFHRRDRSIDIEVADLVNNIPPFIILVLATAGLGFRRRLRILAIGTAILVSGHILFLVLAFRFSSSIQKSPEIPTALGLFLLTLPFLLWIVLAYWDRVNSFLSPEPSTPPEQPAAK